MPPTNRRPRAIDTSLHFCAHAGCASRGWLGLGKLRANGHSNGGPWRPFHGPSCPGYFLETHGTLFHGTQAAVERLVRVLACLAEGLGSRATARGFEVAPTTVLQWLGAAAEQRRAFSAYGRCDLPLEQLQRDAWDAVRRDRKAGESSAEEDRKRLERSPYWVWPAMDPQSKLPVVIDVGSRTLARAQRVGHQVTAVVAPGGGPLLLPDGLKDYATARLTPGGLGMQPRRRQERGPMPTPRGIPLPALL